MKKIAKSRRPIRDEVVGAHEFYISLVLWTGGVIYAVWSMFHETWTWPWHRKPFFNDQIIPDAEWQAFSRVLLKMAPAYVIHSVLSRFLDFYSTKSTFVSAIYRPPWLHVSFTAVALHLTFGYHFTAVVLCVTSVLTVLSFVNNVLFTWLVALPTIYVIVMSELFDIAMENFGVELDDQISTVMTVMTSWNLLKFISMARDGDQCKNFFVRLGYMLYLPTLFCGPLVIFPTFIKGLKNSRCYGGTPSTEDLKILVFRLLRYCLWGFALEFVYSGWDFRFYVPSEWGLWAVCGLGYWLGQALMVKYLVFYGIPSVFAHFEGIEAPPGPLCIGRIARYSDMWRHFDVGLHKFLVRYVYVPVLSVAKLKIVGVVASFGLIYIWHGMTRSVSIWVTINAVGILLEGFLDASVFPSIKSPRKKCAILAFLMGASVISNFFFLGGYVVGSGIFWRVIECSVNGKFWIWFFLYHACILSAYVFEHEG